MSALEEKEARRSNQYDSPLNVYKVIVDVLVVLYFISVIKPKRSIIFENVLKPKRSFIASVSDPESGNAR